MNNRLTHIIITLYIFTCFLAFSQSKKALIIDSDAGTDDYRAIILLTSLKNYHLKAITVSDGTLFPDKGAYRVESLLKCLNIENVQIGVGKKTMYNKPLWRKFAEQVPWSTCYTNPKQTKTYQSAKQVLTDILSSAENNSITFVCLGSLHNLYETIKEKKELSSKIEKIIWYNSTEITHGSNYIFAPQAANYVLSLSVPIYIVHTISNKTIAYDSTFVENIKQCNLLASTQIMHQLNFFLNNNDTIHLKFWDELTAVFLEYPFLFDIKQLENRPNIHFISAYNVESIKHAYLNILKGKHKYYYNGVIFSNFPIDSDYYYNDINEIKQQIIENYGIEEFVLSVLTSEIHHHLGIYSILGVKMGLYAKELLNAPPHQIRITSYAGKKTPLSCLNDGIMISTGSSPAFKEINIDTIKIEPSAKFCYQNQCITLSLKEEIYKEITLEIDNLNSQYNLNSNAYWDNIRKLALKYWLQLDRKKIFDIK